MGLNPRFVEGSRPLAYGAVGVFTEKEVDLLKSTAISLNTVKTPHFNNNGSDLIQLVNPGNILAGRLPHISVQQREFDFTSHIVIFDFRYLVTNKLTAILKELRK